MKWLLKISAAWSLSLALHGTCLAAQPAIARAAPESLYATRFERQPSVSELTDLGRALFYDPGLSASGKMACVTCHDPRFAFGPPTAAPVQRGGPDGRAPGLRSVPSLTYTQQIPPFTEHFFDDDGNDSIDQGPAGGRTWDGRAQTAHDQAVLLLTSPFEMANADAAAVTQKVKRGELSAQVRNVFGAHIFDDPALTFKAIIWALEVFQQSPQELYPYDSKYDAWLRGQATLTAAESRGLAVFNDPQKGNCASCHPSAVRGGAFPQFTDYGFQAIGLPRNANIPANREPAYFDLGLCGPLRTDLSEHHEYCGLFRTPSLRNVALRRVFFHNGAVNSLRDAVRFYAERDTAPEKWYPRGPNGSIIKYNDLPDAFRENVNQDKPFGGKAGEPPALSSTEVDDLVAFLNSLTDGYKPQAN